MIAGMPQPLLNIGGVQARIFEVMAERFGVFKWKGEFYRDKLDRLDESPNWLAVHLHISVIRLPLP